MTTKRTRKPEAPRVVKPEMASTTTHFTVAGMNVHVPAEFYAWIESELGGVLAALDIVLAHPTEFLFDPEEWNGMSDTQRSMAKLCVFQILQQYSEQMGHPFMDPLVTELFAEHEF